MPKSGIVDVCMGFTTAASCDCAPATQQEHKNIATMVVRIFIALPSNVLLLRIGKDYYRCSDAYLVLEVDDVFVA